MNTFLSMSSSAALMILAVVVIRALFIHKLPKKTFMMLWGIVVCRLLLPFTISSPLSIYTWIDRLRPEELTTVNQSSPPITSQLTIPMSLPDSTSELPPISDQIIAFVSPIVVIWIVGAAICTLFFTITYVKCRREFQTSLPVHHPLALKWLDEHKLTRSIQIRQSHRIRSPLTYGIKHPVILLPKNMDWSNVEQLQYILEHEFIHIRRFDQVSKLLLTAVLCIHWFNPLVWVMYMLANRDIELSCDETVVRSFGETTKRGYAMSLITMEERKNRITPLSNHFSKNAIEERIVAIMKMRKTTAAATVLALALIVGATTVFATGSSGLKQDIDTAYAIEGTVTNKPPLSEQEQRSEMKKVLAPYEKFGLIYDEESGRSTYNGKTVRQFFDEIAHLGFSELTGEVDLDAEYTKGELSGLIPASQTEFDSRTKEIQSMPIDANATEVSQSFEISTLSLMSRVDNGATQYSTDEGKTWMTQAELDAMYPVPKVEWWTYDEYKAWLDNETIEL
ncbi:M56 family metallopeptidase [Paenibacillus anaericanus]|uniref:M56 family metallopeptidase n=2 Tax=Paenibacillus TaxID=44249 RepID=A0A433Y6L2_9BACL|nr:M56 family metallopeptidase [Paenibacillus anaericanus]RUT44664.1 M56 family metallopeptidase [Paenibacillus anaericanus]